MEKTTMTGGDANLNRIYTSGEVTTAARAAQSTFRPTPAESGLSQPIKPQRRVILLGASNLTRAFARVVATARHFCGEPIDLLAALGHGRAYRSSSSVLGRGLGPIRDSGLWGTLHELPRVPTQALVTDIGNDLLLGNSAETIARDVRICIERLLAHDANVVITRLPVENLETLSPKRFLFFRRLFFPYCQLTLPEVAAAAYELNERVQLLANELGLTLVSQRPEWYGFDPIHITIRNWPTAWSEILSAFRSGTVAEPITLDGAIAADDLFVPKPPLVHWPYLRMLRPDEYTLFGLRRGRAQPSGRLADGTTISMF